MQIYSVICVQSRKSCMVPIGETILTPFKSLLRTMNAASKAMKQLTLTGRRPPVKAKAEPSRPAYAAGRWFRCEEVPEELMYDEFIYPEDIEMECFESDPIKFDSLPPMDEKLWLEELARRENWFKSWHKPDKRVSKVTWKRRSPRDFRDFAKNSGRW